MDLESMATGEKVALVGAVLTVLGAFLPWVNAGFISVTGIDGDGLFTLLFGVAVGGIILLVGWDLKGAIATAALGLLTILLSGNVYLNLGEVAREAPGMVNAGGGLHLTLIGGIIVLVAGILGYRETKAGEGSDGLVEDLG